MSVHLTRTIGRRNPHLRIPGGPANRASCKYLYPSTYITPPSSSAPSSVRTATALATPRQLSSKLTSSLTNSFAQTQVRTMTTSGGITDWVKTDDKTGEFKRQVSSFRNFISKEPGAEFPPEKGRYHIYVSYACPWAHRTLIARKLKGLEDFISFSVVHWHLGANGWRFVTSDESLPGDNVTPDPLHPAFTHLRDVYFESESDYSGRFTVPVLYDKRQNRIVSNESSEILRMLTTVFDDQLDEKHRAIQLYPEPLQGKIEEAHGWMYDLINNGVYKSGFATTQEAYERNVVALFEALDRVEAHLKEGDGPYYLGKELTEVDVRLYVTLIRFDPVYVQHFKCNIRDIRSGYPAIHAWLRNLYWNHPAFAETTQFEHIKWHYTKSHTQINPKSITPVGPVPNILPLGEECGAVRK